MRTQHVTMAGACALAAMVLAPASARADEPMPHYVADVNWPKPLPDKWVLGGLGGVCVDAHDHVLILNRQDVIPGDLDAGRLAPAMIEFDAQGNVVNSWGDPKLLDPRLHSCAFDPDGNVWIASAPSGMIQKYTHDGKTLLLQVGEKGRLDTSDGTVKGKPLNSAAARFTSPSSIFVDAGNGDVYVSDGESAGGDRRVAVLDGSGKFLRQWTLEDMQTVHCLTMGRDGMVYVCNRLGAELRVYDKMGDLKRTIALPWMPVTPPKDGKVKEAGGAVVAIAFSPDPAQKYIFVINQDNATVDIVERVSGKKLGSFGRAGSFPGEFNQAHGIAVDSKGDIYIAENRGRRVHKFVLSEK
jgi:DNA-binding beta-propeller fold protein YncE